MTQELSNTAVAVQVELETLMLNIPQNLEGELVEAIKTLHQVENRPLESSSTLNQARAR